MPNTYERIKQNKIFNAPNSWLKIKTIEMHTGGEPLRVIIDGFPKLEGNNVLEYRQFIKNNYDHLRRALIHEPRGHADMYGCILRWVWLNSFCMKYLLIAPCVLDKICA